MVYFDNAATTFPKPSSVVNALADSTVRFGANPGRSGHKLSMETANAVYESRQKCADFFAAEVENTVFTLNCTYALNTAIKGFAEKNMHIITTDLEHNAVIRPVHACSKENKCTYSIVKTGSDEETLYNIERLINSKTKIIVCTGASNVTGKILPYKKIGELCKEREICFILDAAQIAGVLPVSLSDNINIICAAGHKGLYGPMGTGLMVTDGKYRLKTIVEGGTGSYSKQLEQPEVLPERFESGTINTYGAIALGAGIDFVKSKSVSKIYEHEWSLCKTFFDGIKNNNKIILYSKEYTKDFVPIVSFNIKGITGEDASLLLSEEGFYLRGGYHCAYLAHKKIGTSEIGAVRFAPSVFNSRLEVNSLIKTINKITKIL